MNTKLLAGLAPLAALFLSSVADDLAVRPVEGRVLKYTFEEKADSELTDASGSPVYDLVVDTRVGMPDAVADVVHDWLVQRGAFGGNDG